MVNSLVLLFNVAYFGTIFQGLKTITGLTNFTYVQNSLLLFISESKSNAMKQLSKNPSIMTISVFNMI